MFTIHSFRARIEGKRGDRGTPCGSKIPNLNSVRVQQWDRKNRDTRTVICSDGKLLKQSSNYCLPLEEIIITHGQPRVRQNTFELPRYRHAQTCRTCRVRTAWLTLPSALRATTCRYHPHPMEEGTFPATHVRKRCSWERRGVHTTRRRFNSARQRTGQ